MEQFYDKDNIVKEFDVENGCVITKPTYGNISIGSEGAKRFHKADLDSMKGTEKNSLLFLQ